MTNEHDTPEITLAKAELPNAQRMDKGGIVFEPAMVNDKGKVVMRRGRNKICDVVEWYANRKQITPKMQQAAWTMQHLFYACGKVPRATPQYAERVQHNSIGNGNDAPTRAKKMLEKALDRLEADEAKAIWDACCYDQLVGRDGLDNLRLGLRALYVFFEPMH